MQRAGGRMRAGTVMAAVATAAVLAAAASPMPAVGPRFTRITMPGPTTDRASTGGVSWADVNGDGHVDLFVTNGFDVSSMPARPQPDRLYLNDGTGRLVASTSWPPPDDEVFSSGSAWGDFDNDGRLDVFVPSQRRVPGLLYRNLGDGLERITDQPPATDSLAAYGAAWIDIDRDGNLDLIAYNGGLSSLAVNTVYRGSGDGRFVRVTDSPLSADSAAFGGGVWADLDDDGDSDLLVPVNGMRGRLRHGLFRNDDGRMTPWEAPALVHDAQSATATAFADYDNDGHVDLFLGAERGIAGRLFRNDGEGGLEYVADASPSLAAGGNQLAPVWADFDNDGDLDLLLVRWGASPTLHLNDGAGSFTTAASGTHGDLDRILTRKGSVAVADYDGDGDLDIYIGNWPDRPGPEEENVLLRNDAPPAGWVMIRLEGTRSNRSAIGATLHVAATIGGRSIRQRREVHTQSTWRSQSDLVQHVGLGDAATIDEVRIRWPSGRVDVCTGLPARARVHVVEGRGWRVEGGDAALHPCGNHTGPPEQ